MRLLGILLAVVLFTACDPQSKEITFTNSDETVSVRIAATRQMKLDPFEVTIGAAGFGRPEASGTYEMQLDDLTSETVKWNWTDVNNCNITFSQPDGSERYFKLISTEKLTRIFEGEGELETTLNHDIHSLLTAWPCVAL